MCLLSCSPRSILTTSSLNIPAMSCIQRSKYDCYVAVADAISRHAMQRSQAGPAGVGGDEQQQAEPAAGGDQQQQPADSSAGEEEEEESGGGDGDGDGDGDEDDGEFEGL